MYIVCSKSLRIFKH